MIRYIKGIIRYTKYVLKHQHYVAKQCFKQGLYRQGMIHDLSKFRFSEAWRYMKRFSMGDKLVEQQFDKAWLGHIRRNKHHWQYWVLIEDSGAIKPLNMPNKYIKEMLCDRWGVGKAFGYKPNDRAEVIEWYGKNKEKMLLHPSTRRCVERFLTEREKEIIIF